MDSNKLLRNIIIKSDALIHVADATTYELDYINPSFKINLGNPDDSYWQNKKCYELLFDSNVPCSCCILELLEKEEFYSWKGYSSVLGIQLMLNTAIVTDNGKSQRVCMANNLNHGTHERELKNRIEEHEILTECINLLHSDTPVEISINKVLSYIANYYNAERAYIFEYAPNELLDNTYEWCKAGITPEIANLQQLPYEQLEFWFTTFKNQGEFYIDSLSTNPNHRNSNYYELLHSQGIESLVAAPLIDIKGNKIVGFLGVDNPAKNVKNTNVLRSAARFISEFFDKNDLMQKLHKISHLDGLTGLKNRNNYNTTLAKFEETPPSTLGVIYVDINELKSINDQHGHKYGDSLIVKLSALLNDIFPDKTYRIGGDEFIIILNNIEKPDFIEKVQALRDALSKREELKASIGHAWNDNSQGIRAQIETADKDAHMNKQEFHVRYTV